MEPQYPLPPSLPGLSQEPWPHGPAVASTPWDNGSSSLGHLTDRGGISDWGTGHIVGCRGTASWDCTRLTMGCLGEEQGWGKGGLRWFEVLEKEQATKEEE